MNVKLIYLVDLLTNSNTIREPFKMSFLNLFI